MIKNGSEVAVKYQLFLDGFDGEMFEETNEENPLSFVMGSGEMLTAFEEAIRDKNPGDSFQIHIPVVDAYGEEKEEFLWNSPKAISSEKMVKCMMSCLKWERLSL